MSTRKSGTASQHSFSQVPRAEIQRSQFNRSSGLKTGFNAGFLYPIFVDEALPGDTFNLSSVIFARLATPIVPFFDNIYVDTFYFAVPNRLLWENWQRFCGEQTTPGDTTDYLVPQIDPGAPGAAFISLSDYIGVPPGIADMPYNALYHRAYNLIYNEWFRDENLVDPAPHNIDDGPDAEADYTVLRRGKRHDYFTSCLPWPQKGPAVQLPLGTSAPVLIDSPNVFTIDPIGPDPTFNVDGANRTLKSANISPSVVEWSGSTTSVDNAAWDDPQLDVDIGGAIGVADLSTATAATINEIRQAFQIQRLYERDARGGTRYTEIIRSHFGVTSPDQRLQRPEYLGGGTTAVNVHPVAQTSTNDMTQVRGQLSAFGVAHSTSQGFVKSFTEHCVIIGLISARADLNYQQGLHRSFSRQTRWDYYWPALSHLGEQAVLNQEIFAQGSGAPGVDIQAFGYQERFAEYRYKPSQVTGIMRSENPLSTDLWHLAQDFSALPVLNESFIEENPPIPRVIALAETHFLMDAFFSLKCARPMPTYSVPGMIDHF